MQRTELFSGYEYNGKRQKDACVQSLKYKICSKQQDSRLARYCKQSSYTMTGEQAISPVTETYSWLISSVSEINSALVVI